jgi:prolipoprotein diacylglyceryltransferase
VLPYLNIGPIGLPTSPLIFIIGVWLALYAVDRAARRLRQDPELHYGLASVVLLAGFLAARLGFVLLHWSAYDDNLLGIIWPLTTGYSSLFGVLGGVAAGYFYGRWRRIKLWPALDVLTPGLAIFLMTVSLADFLGGPGYGSLTALPWGIDLFGVRRHAVQVYELGVGLATLAVWWAATSSPTSTKSYLSGRPFLLATAVYAAGRLFVDAYRETTFLTSGGLHLMQIIALAVLLGVLFMLIRLSTQRLNDTIP